jgi:hypothetical protein
MKPVVYLLLNLFGSLVACSEARLAYHDADDALKSAGEHGTTSLDEDAEGLGMEVDPYQSERSRELATGNCTLCPAGERPHNLWSTLVVNGKRVTCRVAFQSGNLKGTSAQCANYRTIGEDVCLCQKGLPPQLNMCTLCEDGSALPDPNKKIFGSNTCLWVRQEMRRDFERNCYVYQGAVGPYCGCDNPISSSKVCHLCGNKTDILPFPTRMVYGRTCLRHEFEASIARNCMEAIKSVGKKCCS